MKYNRRFQIMSRDFSYLTGNYLSVDIACIYYCLETCPEVYSSQSVWLRCSWYHSVLGVKHYLELSQKEGFHGSNKQFRGQRDKNPNNQVLRKMFARMLRLALLHCSEKASMRRCKPRLTWAITSSGKLSSFAVWLCTTSIRK